VAPPVPEFKGAALCVNGKVWPTLAVEPRAYRFRVLNGCNSRMLVMRLSPADPSAPDEPDTVVPDPGLAMWQIGADGGLFSAAVELKGDLSGGLSTAQLLVLAPGERADILVDFSAVAGRTFYLSNHALDTSPFGNGGDVASSADGSNAILQLVVANSAPQALDLPAVDATLATLGQWAGFGQGPCIVRRYVVKEFFTALTPDDAVSLMQPPPGRPGWNAITLQPDLALFDKPGDLWAGKAPDNSTPLTPAFGPLPAGGPALGTDDLPASPNRHQLGNQVELWEIYNISVDVHPIHLHLASFQVLSRQEILNSDPAQLGATLAVDANEQGWKDTVRANPDQVTRLLVRFDDGGDGTRDYTGHFVWHCHLIEHEDMGMMRPLEI
jgi:spore coat protein A